MKVIRYEDVETFINARDKVVQAAIRVIERYQTPVSNHPAEVKEEVRLDAEAMDALERAVDALRSLDADRGVRDPGTPGEQATGTEPAHGEDRND